MKRFIVLLVVLFVALFMSIGPVWAADGSTVSITFGQKSLDSKDWSDSSLGMDLSKQKELGVDMDFGQGSTKFMFGVAVANSSDTEKYYIYQDYYYDVTAKADVELMTTELRFGMRHIFDASSKVHPYVDGGLAYATAKATIDGQLEYNDIYGNYDYLDMDSESTSGNGFGYFIGAGIRFDVSETIFFGLDAKYTKITAEILDYDTQIGGTRVAALVGFKF